MAQRKPRVLIFSQRQAVTWVSAACFYEFEDLISAWTDADILALPDRPFPIRRKINTVLNAVTRMPEVAAALTPAAWSPWTPKKEYDLFLAVLPTPDFSFVLKDLDRIKDLCGKMAVYVPEVWAHRLRGHRHLLLPLQEFDHIYVSTRHSVDTMAELTGRPTSFLPFAVNTEVFSPAPEGAPRSIDVLTIGRRSPVTHRALLNAAQDTGLFYHYDTIAQPAAAKDPAEHRRMYAELLKRSRFFLSSRANADEPEKTQGAEEVGHRFFEGAAAGAVMVGAPPRTPSMDESFDWQDAVIEAPWDDEGIAERLSALEADPDRLERIRRAGIVQCLRRHDWLYRWEQMSADLGLPLSTEAEQRRAALEERASRFDSVAG
ncbi:MAG: glycosyltransferase [Alphaproteobacteria bacterium]